MATPDTVVNEHELYVFGLQRSGIHAVVNWIVQQSEGPALFVNDVKLLTASPYGCAHEFHWRGGETGDRKFDASAERGGKPLRGKARNPKLETRNKFKGLKKK